MTLTHDEIIERTDEMFKILAMVTEYTNKYGRPSLSDISVFETMNQQFENLDDSGKVANVDIYRAWADYLESGQYFTLEYGWEQQEEQVLDFLEEKAIITWPKDCHWCGFPITDDHDCKEDEDGTED